MIKEKTIFIFICLLIILMQLINFFFFKGNKTSCLLTTFGMIFFIFSFLIKKDKVD
jgi:hypothetical protein